MIFPLLFKKKIALYFGAFLVPVIKYSPKILMKLQYIVEKKLIFLFFQSSFQVYYFGIIAVEIGF